MRCCSRRCGASRAELAAALAALVLVGGCAGVPPTQLQTGALDEAFSIDGRFSARHGNEAVTMHFAWTHASPRDRIVLTSALGQAYAELEGDRSVPYTELRSADGHRAEARDWTTLTLRTLGVPLPVDDLAWWARGAPRADLPRSVDNDALGRPHALRQDGCEVVYGYADDSARRPSRLNVACRDIEMRIVIDRWQEASAD